MTNGQQKEWRKERRINEYGSLDQRRKDEQVLIEEEEEDVVCCLYVHGMHFLVYVSYTRTRLCHKSFLVYRKKVFFLSFTLIVHNIFSFSGSSAENGGKKCLYRILPNK